MSIVAMKKKMEAKRGLSTGGKGFSINPKVKCSDVNSTTVGSARQARQNLVKRAVCFSGSEGIQCERVWDGKRAPNCMGPGDSITQEEYIEKKRTNAASCKNVLLNFNNTIANVSTLIVEYNNDTERYEIEYLGKKSSVDWNHTNKYIGDIVSSIGNVQFSANGGTTECLLPTSFVEIVNSGGSNYYVLNGGTTYGSDISYGVYDGKYVLKNVPEAHPIALINNGINGITYSINDDTPFVINVAGGQNTLNGGGDYFDFTRVDTGATINIGNGNFKFMRGKTYRFVDAGINSGYGFGFFKIGVQSPTQTLGSSGAFTNNITNVTTPTSAVSIINDGNGGSQYRLNGSQNTTDISYGMANGNYQLTSIPESQPLGIVNESGLISYSVDDTVGAIVINVAGGVNTPDGNGDYYNFTDSGGNAISLANGSFKFMRGRSYRFVNNGVTDTHQFKIYVDGNTQSNVLGNSGNTSGPASDCLDPNVSYDVTANKDGNGNYTLTNFKVFDGAYQFTNIPQSAPIAFLNNGVAGITYRVIDSTPIRININGLANSGGADASGDYYSFSVDGTPISIADGSFKFMRGMTYEFYVNATIGTTHPFNLYHNGVIVSGTGSNGVATSNLTAVGDMITLNINENHPLDATNLPYAPAGQLYYRCQYHSGMSANLALSVLDVGNSVVYDFFYGTVEVTIDSGFNNGVAVNFRDLDGGQSSNGLTYSSTCQNANADGDAEITFKIPSSHGINTGAIHYIHQNSGGATGNIVNMSLTAINIGGTIVDHYYGNINVLVAGDFGNASVRNFNGDFTGGVNLIAYGAASTSSWNGVGSFDVNINPDVIQFANAGNAYYKKFVNGVVDGDVNKITTQLLIRGVDGNNYNFYHGDVNIDVAAGGFSQDVSVYCYYHGYMGGENLLTYTTGCDINLSGTGDRNGPATFTVSSFSNVNPRTVELSKEAGQPVVLSFKNPEKYIFEPVGCDSLSAGSGLGGTAGSDDRGYYGRGRCKVHYVNKSPEFEPKNYHGTGGYLDKIKRPHTDVSFCG